MDKAKMLLDALRGAWEIDRKPFPLRGLKPLALGAQTVYQAVAKGSATIGSVTVDFASTVGALVTILEKLRETKPTLGNEAKATAEETEAALTKAVDVDTPNEEKRSYILKAATLLKTLVASAPNLRL